MARMRYVNLAAKLRSWTLRDFLLADEMRGCELLADTLAAQVATIDTMIRYA